MAIQMAVEEINAKGGVQVGNAKHSSRPIPSIRGSMSPGSRCRMLDSDGETHLEKKPHAIALGNFRSEVLLASMDLMSKYKLPYICSIAMTRYSRRRLWRV